jgi:hypothetical protein
MIQKNLFLICALIAMGIFAYLYFTKETLIVNTGDAEILKLKTEISTLENAYNLDIERLQDSIAREIHVKDSIIKQKNEKELADIMDMPIDSLYKLFSRLTTE